MLRKAGDSRCWGSRRALHQCRQHSCTGRARQQADFCCSTAHSAWHMDLACCWSQLVCQAARHRGQGAAWRSSREQAFTRAGIRHNAARQVTVQTPAPFPAFTWWFLSNLGITWKYCRRYGIIQQRSSKAGFVTYNTRRRLSNRSTELMLMSLSMDTIRKKAILCTTW